VVAVQYSNASEALLVDGWKIGFRLTVAAEALSWSRRGESRMHFALSSLADVIRALRPKTGAKVVAALCGL
jgi:hypothetical protein